MIGKLAILLLAFLTLVLLPPIRPIIWKQIFAIWDFKILDTFVLDMRDLFCTQLSIGLDELELAAAASDVYQWGLCYIQNGMFDQTEKIAVNESCVECRVGAIGVEIIDKIHIELLD